MFSRDLSDSIFSMRDTGKEMIGFGSVQKCDGLAHVKKHPESLKTSKEALTTIKHNYPKSARLVSS